MTTTTYFEIRPSRGLKRLRGKAYVALVASANGETLSVSETLNSEEAIERNIEARRSASTAPVKDLRAH